MGNARRTLPKPEEAQAEQHHRIRNEDRFRHGQVQHRPQLRQGQEHDQAGQKLANTFGARGTPNFFINGRKVTGARPFPAFKTIIDEEVKKAEALLKKGTPKAKIYAELTKNGKTKAAAPAARKAPPEDKTVYTVPVNANDMVKGGKNAKVTIVEFSEFQCPFCSRVNPTISQIQKEYGDKVRIVFKHNLCLSTRMHHWQ